jgi:Ni/Co efflux regulator RcnB
MMKKLLTSMALVALIASPVLAQTKDRPAQRAQAQTPQAYTTQTQQQQQQQQRSVNRGNDVYDIHGRYVGTDPDSTVRSQLANDPNQGD